jgi:HAD superfamily hydrolase (TIGR01509 family)
MTAVIFDCDGTLVDSEPLAMRAWTAALAPFGCTVTDADTAATIGLSYARVHAYYAERAPLPERAEFWPLLAGELFALIDAELRPFADAEATVRELHERGVPLAVASSSPRERLDRTLRRSGLAPLLPVTVAGDEVDRGKPAPDMFLAAAKRLDAAPGECIVVEDTPVGVAAGLAAGMTTVAVRRELGAANGLAGAHVVLDLLTADAVLAAHGGRPSS